jgi:uncharacterized protein YndB with AHSA1/START domain
MKRIIKHTYFFAHPPQIVWDYLTKPDLMALWLMKNNFKPEVGTKFQFTTGAKPAINFDGVFHCEVLVVDPFTQLSYSWDCGPGEGKINLKSVVLWQLQATDKGTEVLLEHSGFERDENVDLYNGLNHGWVEKFHNIEKLLNAPQHDTTNA